jgi:hypothetical protein
MYNLFWDTHRTTIPPSLLPTRDACNHPLEGVMYRPGNTVPAILLLAPTMLKVPTR